MLLNILRKALQPKMKSFNQITVAVSSHFALNNTFLMSELLFRDTNIIDR